MGEFVRSLDGVDALDARLALSGHGRPFVDVRGHIEGNRRLVAARLAGVVEALSGGRSLTAVELVAPVFGDELGRANAQWRLQEMLCYLRHLEVEGEVVYEDGPEGEKRWRVA